MFDEFCTTTAVAVLAKPQIIAFSTSTYCAPEMVRPVTGVLLLRMPLPSVNWFGSANCRVIGAEAVPDLVMDRDSAYCPASTSTVCPGETTFRAAWMVQ